MDTEVRQLIWDRAKKYYPEKASHGLNHIEDNLNKAEKMLAHVKEPFTDQIYAAIVFHDAGLEKYGRDIHEVHGAEIAKRELKDLFNSRDLYLIAAAIKEHRASFKGTFTSMLSDICSSADRNAPNFEASVARSFLYTSEHHPEFSFEEKCETVAKHQRGKYGTKGYARFPIYYSRYYRNDLREYQRKMDALTSDVVAKVVGNNGKNASKLYDVSLEALSDKVASNIVNDKVYHASPKKFDVISGKKSNTLNAKSSVFVSPFKHFASMFILDFQGIVDQIEEQIGKKHIKIDNFGFMEWNETPRSTTSIPSKVHVLVRTPENFKPFKGKATGYMYTIDFSKYKDQANMWSKAKDSDVEFTIHGDVKPEKCEQISYEYEVLKDTKQYNHAEESMDEFASETMQDTVSVKKMYFANNDGKLPKDANGNIVLTKNVIDATIYAAFDQFNDSKVAMACKGFVQYKNGTNKHVLVAHGDDSLTEPEEMDCVGTIYSVTLSEPIEFRYHGHRGFGKCQLPKIYTVKEEALKDAQIKKEESVKFKATFEYEKSLTMQHATENLDIEAGLLQEFNAGIEKFNRWVRDLELKYLRDELNDEQVTMAFEQIAQENILTDTVKTIFRKIGEFIGWFLRKLKELWNYFFGKTQRATRALKAANERITRHNNSNGFFNDAAFNGSKAPQGLVNAIGLDKFITMGFSPDEFYTLFNEMLDMWASHPEDLYEEIFVRFNQSPTTHKWHTLIGILPTGSGPNAMDAIKFTKSKYPASGTMRESAYDKESVIILLKEAMDAVVAYEKNSKLIASKGNIAAEAAKRVMEYQDRTDITEHEAMQMAKEIQELGNYLQVVFKCYQKAYEFILEQTNEVAKVYLQFMK